MTQTSSIRPCPFLYRGSIHSQTGFYSLYTAHIVCVLRSRDMCPSVEGHASFGRGTCVLRSKDDNINAYLEKVEWASDGM